ncbi:hypothetical protein ABEB36_006885 [Hypothenemus hampei]|uniref:Mitochondrial ribonuclease P catalytic subunit n=1 Tax=Hypothenemus hampei TaxID=57062 RepID=A0ABD1ES13_HYPHA
MFLSRTDSKIVNFIRKYCNVPSYAKKNRNNDNTFKNKSTNEVVISVLQEMKIQKCEDWNKVKQLIFDQNRRGKISETGIDGLIMNSILKLNRVDLAKDYLNYLEASHTKPNLATVGKYLKLLYQNHSLEKLSKSDENEIIKLCKEITDNNPVLESRTLENMALALSLTKDWKQCLEIIQEIKRTAAVAGTVYDAVATAAFKHKEEPVAWNLLNQAVLQQQTCLNTAFLSYLETIKKQRKLENKTKSLEKLFLFFRDNEIVCNEDVINEIQSSIKMGKQVTMNFKGVCSNCQLKLEKLELSDSEFLILKEAFFKNVIVGKDIFIKSNPNEMKKFQNFLSNMEQYDVILDGLNIAYSSGVNKGPYVFSRLLHAVVKHFVQKNKSVLILGRSHMNKWPRMYWSYIKENASVFLTENISEDDPYMLYFALQSGKNTIIVTRDLMRGHKFLLKDRTNKMLFNRWLSQRQYMLSYVNDKEKCFFRVPPEFYHVAQKNGDVWHIPYNVPQENEEMQSYHKTWLCINL